MGAGASIERLEVVERDAPQTGKDRPLWQRGVTVEWLVNFTNTNKCWDLRTWEVCDQVVKPACNGVCRYVELESVESTGCVGHCDVFVSHTWGANFGNLVAAVVSVVPRSWRVWIDIFAVLQFPGGGLDDLRFDEVVKRSRGCLLVVAPDKDVLAIDPMQILNNKNAIRPDQRVQVPFLRIWCLLEINEAFRLHVPIIVLAGERNGHDNCAFKANAGVALSLLVDVEQAEAKFEDDRVRILNLVLQTSTFAAVNDAVRGAVTGSTYSTHYPELIQASLGNEVLDGFNLAQRRGSDGTTPLDAACSLGVPKLVIELIERVPN